jgi:hypothetical protein
MFNKFEIPISGIFYKDKELKIPLFVGILKLQDDKPFIEIVEKYKNENQFDVGGGCGYGTLFAKLRNRNMSNYIENYTFFECGPSRTLLENSDFIEFESICKYRDISFKNEHPDKFLSEKDKFTEISFEIENLNDWLWKTKWSLRDKKFQVKARDAKGNILTRCKETGENLNSALAGVEIPIYTIYKVIKVSPRTTIEIHSEPSFPTNVDYSGNNKIQTEFRLYSYITIKRKSKTDIMTFYRIMLRVIEFLNLLGNGNCRITRIFDWKFTKHYFEFYHRGLSYKIKDIDFIDKWHPKYSMLLTEIDENLDKSMKLFFSKYKTYYQLIQFVIDMNRTYDTPPIDIHIIQQLQMIETYGNIKLKGKYTANNKGKLIPSDNFQDLMKIINSKSMLPNKIFDFIFIHNYKNNDTRGIEVFGWDNKDKKITELRKLLLPTLSEIRNYIVHPYKNGKPKELKHTKIPENFCRYEDNSLHNIGYLSNSLKMLLRYLVYREIKLDKYFDND